MIVLWLLILRERRSNSGITSKARCGSLWIFFSAHRVCYWPYSSERRWQRGARRSADASGYFFEPLWTNFRLGEETGS